MQRIQRSTSLLAPLALTLAAALAATGFVGTSAGASNTPPASKTVAKLSDVPDPILAWKGDEQKIIDQYRSTLKELSSTVCSKGEDHTYQKLLKEFRGKGHYVPEYPKGKVDLATIRAYLPEIRAKREWITARIEDLKKQRRLPYYGKLTAPLRTELKRAVALKKAHRLAKTDEQRKKALAEAAANLAKIKHEFNVFVGKVPFLLSYGFPVNHFDNRQRFESVKSKPRLKQLANRVFFKRSLHEDGTFNARRARPDEYLRTAIDTLALRLPQEKDLISENVRSDLEWVIDAIHPYLSEGRRSQLARLREWKKRTEEALAFYTELAANKNQAADRLIQTKAQATAKLKGFVQKKQAEVYRFFHGKPELMQALFSLESILFNEIGPLRDFDRVDRRDIIQVVLNRTEHPGYSRIPDSDPLYRHLVKQKGLTASKIRGAKWLNVHFKEGEFSFTYYFIPAVVTTFCPDQSRRAWNIRETNIELALEMLRRPNRTFSGLRYFSRGSMTGRIDMSEIWKQYERIPERPGTRALDQLSPRRHVENDNYRFLYRFQDPDGRWYDVIEIGDKKYSLGEPGLDQPGAEEAVFYHYRDPHRFSYFQPAQGYQAL